MPVMWWMMNKKEGKKGRKKKNEIASLCSILGLLLILAVAVICIPGTVPQIFGYEAYSIISGSMEPEIPTGSMVYAKTVSPDEVSVGDIIVFYGGADKTAVTTHRVAAKDTVKKEFVTKGDANVDRDPYPVSYIQLIGRVEKSIPVLGTLLPFVTGVKGKFILISILMAGVIFRVLGIRLRESK